ncbi:MAG TPA: xanthine dehydrogenase family protein molybdopterin-binding subunit [Mucilaginibacter sp.]|nr:xanthine dehydrogenase family protein molybdopterin-binding subunit [Mucilaginibacter sp.]
MSEKNDLLTSDPVKKAGLSRVDGRLKVTGKAKYSAEYNTDGIVYGVLAGSTATSGTIKSIDTKSAQAAPGVLSVITYLNAPKIPGYQTDSASGKGALKIFYDNKIYFNGQPVALVVADSFERALYAASLVKAVYDEQPHQTDLIANLNNAFAAGRGKDYNKGQEDAWLSAAQKVEQEYVIPTEVHNPMELHATIARWDAADKVSVWTKSQGVKASQRSIAQAFKLPPENVQVTAPFVGGAFGSALRTWPHEIAAVLAAKVVGKPVKLVLSRADMFTSVGYRPYTWQKVSIGANADGKLAGIRHEAIGQSSVYEDFTEGVVNISQLMYACPNISTRYKIVSLNVNTPTPMRGPGEATGAFALESAMDELSYALNIDPVEFRMRNYAETDPSNDKPYSSKFLKEAYQIGAEKIGWEARSQKPGSVMENGWLAGYGMAAGMFGAHRSAATVTARMMSDGTLILQTAVTDIGPGTGTAMASIAAEMMGIPADRIKVEIGDSSLPPSPTQGGSQITSTVGSAVHDACAELLEKFKSIAGTMPATDYSGILKQQNLDKLEVTTTSKSGPDQGKYALYSWSVHFMKVLVHPTTGVVKVDKAISVADAGTIISPKTARSQMIGGTIMGIGMALMEEVVIDHKSGRLMNNNFADYHVPVQADVPQVEAYFVNKPDEVLNPIGAKGMGEIATIGVAAAAANAVYNACGKRVRDLPITPDKVMA